MVLRGGKMCSKKTTWFPISVPYLNDILSLVHHLLDWHIFYVMYCEKNFCRNMSRTLLGMNDSPLTYKRQMNAPKIVNIVSNICTPTSYVGGIHKHLVDGKLQYMKTYDYHVLRQQTNKHLMLWKMSFAILCQSPKLHNVCRSNGRQSMLPQRTCTTHIAGRRHVTREMSWPDSKQ